MMKGICSLLAVLAVRGAAAEWLPVPGVVSGEIKTQQNPDCSYVLYLPKVFNSQRAWPVLFVMSPGGGSKGTLTRYLTGAELNGWMLACSVQSKNGNQLSGEAVNAMVADVCARLPVDQARLYASGFSGGARMAFWLGSQKPAQYPLAGVLACGAGANPALIPAKLVAYGVNGALCFNRWDMACTFRVPPNKAWRLVYFAGRHEWGAEPLITDGMLWLNGTWLKTAPATTPHLAEERAQFASAVLGLMEKMQAGKPERAFDHATFMLDFPVQGAVRQKLVAAEHELAQQPRVQLYAKAWADLEKFWRKHFATSPDACFKDNGGSPAATHDANRLVEQYKTTILAPVFKMMGTPTGPMPGVKPGR